MTIHTLEKEKHKDFLTQNRIDPITGDLLEANDKIVLCAVCKSAFLVDSWEYMGGKHCNQTHTLTEIPKSEVVRMDKSSIYLNVNLEVKTISNKKAAEDASINLTLPALLVFVLLYFINGSNSTLGVLPCLFFPFSYFFYWIFNNYKTTLNLKGKFLSFKKNTNWEDDILLSSIKSIRYYQPKRFWIANLLKKPQSELYTLEFILKDDTKYKILLTKKELEHIKTETNLLQKFNKNPLPALSVHVKIEQNLAN